ncbi:MAG: MerR family transcriptional regulator [Pseudomonadota bacterium]
MALIPIGQFSKMTRLSVKALRLYDDGDLLPPAHVEASSGYRYYHIEQAHRAELIRALRTVDMPLDEIRTFLDTGDREQANQQLRTHHAKLTEKLAAQERMLTYLEAIIQHKNQDASYDIHITEESPRFVVAVKIHTGITRIANDIAAGFSTLVLGLEHAEVKASEPPMLLYHSVIDVESDGDIEICVPVERDFANRMADTKVYCRILEGGSMASTLHHGPYPEITPAYHNLTRWISENNYEITGPVREIYLNDPQTVTPESLLTQVEFPIGASPREQG